MSEEIVFQLDPLPEICGYLVMVTKCHFLYQVPLYFENLDAARKQYHEWADRYVGSGGLVETNGPGDQTIEDGSQTYRVTIWPVGNGEKEVKR